MIVDDGFSIRNVSVTTDQSQSEGGEVLSSTVKKGAKPASRRQFKNDLKACFSSSTTSMGEDQTRAYGSHGLFKINLIVIFTL